MPWSDRIENSKFKLTHYRRETMLDLLPFLLQAWLLQSGSSKVPAQAGRFSPLPEKST